MEPSSVFKAFLFTDIVGATALKQRLGDVAGARAIAWHDALFRECLATFDGEEQENPGDGFFATFGLPSDALRCALAFQQRLAGAEGAEEIVARVGIHMGESVRVSDSDDPGGHEKLLGIAIDTAARVMAIAAGRQILLTRNAFDSVRQQVITTADDAPIEWLAHGPYRLKGLEEPVEIFEAGIPRLSPLAPPPDSDSGQRVVLPGDEETLGWRPAAGREVPSRESWELERKLGEGGFGEVWLARHKETHYVRAFKFCFQSDRLRSLKRELKLFSLLRDALGDRPDIARLYEVRLQEAPYFLEMEYTAGGNLAEWAESVGGIGQVPLERRLELVAQVGDALSAAHSVGIVHKDVKPANVLMHEEHDGRLQARLTDFGIGELLSPERMKSAGMTLSEFDAITRTQSGYRTLTGTQLYMAPELLASQPPTIKTDIYALGVLLFQTAIEDLGRPIAHGWEREIEDEVLRDDIAQCVAGNPDERLPAASALSLRLRTIDQRRERRRSERQRRMLLRVSSVVAAALLVLFGAAGIALWQVDRARRAAVAAEARAAEAAVRAERQAAIAHAVNDFLREDLLGAANPRNTPDREITVREVLDAAAEKIAGKFADEPLVEAAIRATLADTYISLGEYAVADRQVTRARELRLAELGAEHPDTLTMTNLLARVYRALGRYEEAEPLFVETLEMRRRVLGEDHEDTLQSKNNLAHLYNRQERYAEAEALYLETLESCRRVLGEEHIGTLSVMNNLALVYKQQQRYDEAEALYVKTLELRRRTLGDEHPQTLTAMNNLATLYTRQGRYAQAESLYLEVLASLRRILGDEHPNTLSCIENLGVLDAAQGRFEAAASRHRQVLDARRRVLGPDHRDTLQTLLKLAEALIELKQLAEAESVAIECYERHVSVYGVDHKHTRSTIELLGDLYARWDKPEAAARWRTRLPTTKPTTGAPHAQTPVEHE
jgi:serine/threonine-protein kinase